MEIPWEVCAFERPCRNRSASWRPTDRNPDSEEPEIRNAGKCFAGIDWGSEPHQGCIRRVGGVVAEPSPRRGRNAHCCAPPRTDPDVDVHLSGSYLGYWTANRWTGLRLPVSRPPPVARVPDTAFGACLGVPDSPGLRPVPPAAPQQPTPPGSPPSPVLRPHPTSSNRTSWASGFSFPLRSRDHRRDRWKISQGSDRRRADVHGFSDTAGLAGISPRRCLRGCLRPI